MRTGSCRIRRQRSASSRFDAPGDLVGAALRAGVVRVRSGTGSPVSPFAYLTAALELVRREITRFPGSIRTCRPPRAISVLAPGVMTGSLNAVDAEGDPAESPVVRAPEHGTVIVDPEGAFTYTAGATWRSPAGWTNSSSRFATPGFI